MLLFCDTVMHWIISDYSYIVDDVVYSMNNWYN